VSLIPIWLKLAIAAAIVAGAGFFGYREGVSREHDRAQAILQAEKARSAQELSALSNAANVAQAAIVKRLEATQQEVAAIDQQRTKEKSDALAENARLASDVAAGRRRLRIAIARPATPAGGSDVPKDTAAASVGDAGTVELSPEAGLAVYDLRQSIIGDQSALRALQDYARSCSR
jgi:prophage endopeptidase